MFCSLVCICRYQIRNETPRCSIPVSSRKGKRQARLLGQLRHQGSHLILQHFELGGRCSFHARIKFVDIHRIIQIDDTSLPDIDLEISRIRNLISTAFLSDCCDDRTDFMRFHRRSVCRAKEQNGITVRSITNQGGNIPHGIVTKHLLDSFSLAYGT
jgi:hypothetical protein